MVDTFEVSVLQLEQRKTKLKILFAPRELSGSRVKAVPPLLPVGGIHRIPRSRLSCTATGTRYGKVLVNDSPYMATTCSTEKCHSDEYASASRSLQWHSGLKRSGYDVRILGVYKLLDGSLSTGLPMSSADDAYL